MDISVLIIITYFNKCDGNCSVTNRTLYTVYCFYPCEYFEKQNRQYMVKLNANSTYRVSASVDKS